MKFLSRSVSILAIALAPLAAQTSVLPYLPKNTIVAVSAPDLVTSLDEFQKMPLAKMYAEEEVQNFLADLKERAAKEIEKVLAQGREMHAQGQLPFHPDDVLKLRLRGVTFALTHMELAMGEFGPQPKFGLVLHLDFGPTAPQWQQLLQIGLGMVEGQAGEQVTKTESKIGEWSMVSYAPAHVDDAPMALNIVNLPEGLLIGTLADEVREIAKNVQAKTPVLGASDDYTAAANHLPTDGAEMVSFARYDPMIDFGVSLLRVLTQMESDMPKIDMEGVDRAITAMGLRGLPVDIATSSYAEGKCVTRTFRASRDKGTTAAARTIDMSFLKWVPKDAVSFSAGKVDVMSLYDKLLKGLQAYDADTANMLLGKLAEMETQIGFKLREDLLGSIGDHFMNWSMPIGTITSAPEMALLLKVNDADRLVKSLKAMTAMSQGTVELEESDRRGLKVFQLRINADPNQGAGGMNPLEMFTPTFAFKDGYLVGGFSASDIKRVFQRMDREDDPKGDIRSNREFAAIAANLPTGLDSVSFTDWKASFEGIYQIATGLLSWVPVGEDVPLDMSLLPDSAALTKHLYGGIAYSRAVEGGHESESITPFGPELMLGVGAAAGVGALVLTGLRASAPGIR
ncbi:MAG: hypothetical protein JNL08_17435 [Planctomycetes bacterium]|nr:hypothetical protein [Planctomycetota bacterium]